VAVAMGISHWAQQSALIVLFMAAVIGVVGVGVVVVVIPPL